MLWLHNIDKVDIDIINLQGQVFYSTVFGKINKNEEKRINLSSLPQSFYITEVQYNNRLSVFKIIKR